MSNSALQTHNQKCQETRSLFIYQCEGHVCLHKQKPAFVKWDVSSTRILKARECNWNTGIMLMPWPDRQFVFTQPIVGTTVPAKNSAYINIMHTGYIVSTTPELPFIGWVTKPVRPWNAPWKLQRWTTQTELKTGMPPAISVFLLGQLLQ